MSWPGQRWSPGDIGVTGPLFSRADGSGGAETLRRIMESRGRRSGGGGGAEGGASLLGGVTPMSSPPAEPPATVTADTTGTATVAVETAGTGVEHVGVSVNDGPPMWVPVVGGTGAIQVAVSAGDEITAAGAEHIEIVVEGD